MKIKYRLKKESVQSPEYGQNKAGESDGAAGNRYANSGMEEGIIQNIKGKLGAAKNWASKKLGMQQPKNPDEYAGITSYLGRLHDKTSQQVSAEVMNIVRIFASKQFANDPNKAKQYITAKKTALQALLLDDSADPNSYKDFPEEAKKILNNYFSNTAPAQIKDKEDIEADRERLIGPHVDESNKQRISLNQNPDTDDDGVYSPAELEYHFDLDQDGEVAPEEYEDHIKWHERNPEVFEINEETLYEKKDRCYRLAKQKYDVFPSAYASGFIVRCRKGKVAKKKKS